MKNSIKVSLGLGFVSLALIVLGFFIVRPVWAQVVATSTELLLGTTTPAESVVPESASTTVSTPAEPSASPGPAVLGASTSTEESTAMTQPDTAAASAAPAAEASQSALPPTESSQPTATSTQTVVTVDGFVEVQLECPMSYTAPLYDTPSGHLDGGYFIGEPVASTTGMTAAHEIGTQAWTVCHDDEGTTYEFKISQEEYDSYKLSGTPQKSVMKPAAAPVAVSESTTTLAASTTPATPTPTVLGASTSTPPSDALPPAEQGTSTPLE